MPKRHKFEFVYENGTEIGAFMHWECIRCGLEIDFPDGFGHGKGWTSDVTLADPGVIIWPPVEPWPEGMAIEKMTCDEIIAARIHCS